MAISVDSEKGKFEDLPADREYADRADADLDKALVEAIQRAEEADYDYLSNLLKAELKSHYYRSKVGV